MRTVYLIREVRTGDEWWSDCSDESDGFKVVDTAVEFDKKVENLGYTYDVLRPTENEL